MKNIFPEIARFGALLSCLLSMTACNSLAAPHPKNILVVTVTTGFPHSSIPLAEKTLTELGEKSG
ncbi:MAG: hypothetical protein ABI042_02745, partial [Verrucomicrobiota bacterium]